jgi:hypothetical protein
VGRAWCDAGKTELADDQGSTNTESLSGLGDRAALVNVELPQAAMVHAGVGITETALRQPPLGSFIGRADPLCDLRNGELVIDIERPQCFIRHRAFPSWTTPLDATFRQCLGDATTAHAHADCDLTFGQALVEVKTAHTFGIRWGLTRDTTESTEDRFVISDTNHSIELTDHDRNVAQLISNG